MGLKRVVEFVTCVMLAIMVLTTAASAAAVISSDNLVTVPSSGLSNYVYTVSGTGFAINAQVWVRSPTGVTYQVTETAWAIAGTYIRGYLTIPSSAAAGSYAVYVQNPGATAVYRTGMFTKSGSVATITGDSLVTVPASGWSGMYYVYGTGFASGAQVWVRSPAGVLYAATGETTLSPTTVRGTLVIPSSAAAGSYAVYVQNPGATAVYRTGMFTKSGSTPASISAFSPNYATRGVSKTVYVYGSNFQPGAQVIIYKGGATALQATSETFINSNTIRCVIYVSTSQPNGYYYGGVINPGMGFYPRANAFYLY